MSFTGSPDTQEVASSEYKHTGTPDCPLCKKLNATAKRSRALDEIRNCYEEPRAGEYTRTL